MNGETSSSIEQLVRQVVGEAALAADVFMAGETKEAKRTRLAEDMEAIIRRGPDSLYIFADRMKVAGLNLADPAVVAEVRRSLSTSIDEAYPLD